jgi:hypothetical protein
MPNATLSNVLDCPTESAPSDAEIERLCRERRLAEQEIIRQGFEKKNRQLWELAKRVEMLEDLLRRSSPGHGSAVPSSAGGPWAPRAFPRRWNPRQ